MTNDLWDIVGVIEAAVLGADVDLTEAENHQVAFDPRILARLSSRTQTASGSRLLEEAFDYWTDQLFAERGVHARTLERWGITKRLQAKLFVSELLMHSDGSLVDRAPEKPFPIVFTAADVAWMDLQLSFLGSRLREHVISERQFDAECRTLFAKPPVEHGFDSA